MTSKEYLEAYPARINELRNRLTKALDGLSDEVFNQKAPSGWWSIGQIVEHLTISNAPYLDEMTASASGSPKSGGTDEIKHTWFAKFIINAMDNPNAPAPKSLYPKEGPTPRDMVDTLMKQYEDLLKVADKAKDVNLTEARIRNPFFKLAKMNLADMFEVLATHTERHTKQIEGLASPMA